MLRDLLTLPKVRLLHLGTESSPQLHLHTARTKFLLGAQGIYLANFTIESVRCLPMAGTNAPPDHLFHMIISLKSYV